MVATTRDKERRKPTAKSVLEKVLKCETEVGIQIETMRGELQQHKDAFTQLQEDWEEFKTDFAEMLGIFRSAKGFFKVLGWIGFVAKWIAVAGIAIGTVVTAIKTGVWK